MITRSHETSRRRPVRFGRFAVCLAIALAVASFVSVSTNGRRFYDDDPIARDPESQDASGAKPTEIGLMFEMAYNLFVTGHYKPSGTRARNINTIDEVPDSSWFTNRVGSSQVTAAEIAVGPAAGPP